MAARNAFVDYLSEVRPLIDRWLTPTSKTLEPGGSIQEDLLRYLFDPYDFFVAGGGKRTRPALCLLGCEAVGGNREHALSVAAAIEHFQAAALIHDDIADESLLRRGHPCLHCTEGVGLAVNAGDHGLVRVISTVLGDDRLAKDVRLRIIEELVSMEERTLEGQALDLGWARDGRWDITEDEYLYMARHKTAYYSAATPLAAGAIVGSANEEQVRALWNFGMGAGLAFQLQDDLMNLVGDGEKQGKDFRSDITEGKRTLVVVRALETLGGTQRDELLDILSSHETDPQRLADAVQLLDESGAVDYVRQYAHTLVERAKLELDGQRLDEHAVEILRAMADYFVERSN